MTLIVKKNSFAFVFLILGVLTALIQAQQTHVLKLCNNLNRTLDKFLETPLTNHDFAMTVDNDQNCIAINPCTEKNNRDQAVPKERWLSRKMPEVQFDDEIQLSEMYSHSVGANFLHSSYNFYNIEYAQVPEGIILHTCQPDLANHSTTQRRCGENKNTMKTVNGKCPSASGTYTLFDCVASTEFDSHLRTVLHLYDGVQFVYWRTVCYDQSAFTDLGKNLCAHMNDNLYLHQHTYINAAADAGTTQNFMYEFEQNYGCFDSPGVGFYLSSIDKPNQMLQCPQKDNAYGIVSGILTECAYACDTGYFMQDDTCMPNCADVTIMTCPENSRITETCSTMLNPRYKCQECDIVSGHSVIPLSLRSNKELCEYSPCNAGTYSSSLSNGLCLECPLDTFSGAVAESCMSCNTTSSKQYQPHAGKSTCIDCFSNSIDSTCSDGEQMFQDFDMIVNYFETISHISSHYMQFKNMSKYCHQNHACLPCHPGFYEVEGVCTACPYGTYQPNFKSTSCFDCSRGQNTSSTASASEDSCLCQLGFH